ncbi:hypothetical protein D3C71_1935980 [compost metagenome]
MNAGDSNEIDVTCGSRRDSTVAAGGISRSIETSMSKNIDGIPFSLKMACVSPVTDRSGSKSLENLIPPPYQASRASQERAIHTARDASLVSGAAPGMWTSLRTWSIIVEIMN